MCPRKSSQTSPEDTQLSYVSTHKTIITWAGCLGQVGKGGMVALDLDWYIRPIRFLTCRKMFLGISRNNALFDIFMTDIYFKSKRELNRTYISIRMPQIWYCIVQKCRNGNDIHHTGFWYEALYKVWMHDWLKSKCIILDSNKDSCFHNISSVIQMYMLKWLLRRLTQGFRGRKGLFVRIPLSLALTVRIPSQRSIFLPIVESEWCQNTSNKNCCCQSPLYGQMDPCHMPGTHKTHFDKCIT